MCNHHSLTNVFRMEVRVSIEGCKCIASNRSISIHCLTDHPDNASKCDGSVYLTHISFPASLITATITSPIRAYRSLPAASTTRIHINFSFSRIQTMRTKEYLAKGQGPDGFMAGSPSTHAHSFRRPYTCSPPGVGKLDRSPAPVPGSFVHQSASNRPTAGRSWWTSRAPPPWTPARRGCRAPGTTPSSGDRSCLLRAMGRIRMAPAKDSVFRRALVAAVFRAVEVEPAPSRRAGSSATIRHRNPGRSHGPASRRRCRGSQEGRSARHRGRSILWPERVGREHGRRARKNGVSSSTLVANLNRKCPI
jgi:hypothetical protein